MAGLRQQPVWTVFDGQSLNIFGDYAVKVMAGYTERKYRNVAVGGMTWAQLAVTQATRCHQYARVAKNNVLLLNGCNTALASGSPAATVYAAAKQYAADAKAAGFTKVLIVTVPAAKIPDYYSAGEDTERLALNATLVATGVSSGDFDAVADIAAHASLATWSGTYFDDIVHWNSAGAQVAADIVIPVYTALTP